MKVETKFSIKIQNISESQEKQVTGVNKIHKSISSAVRNEFTLKEKTARRDARDRTGNHMSPSTLP